MTEREREVLTEINRVLTVTLEGTAAVTPADRLADCEVLDSLGLITLELATALPAMASRGPDAAPSLMSAVQTCRSPGQPGPRPQRAASSFGHIRFTYR